MAFVPVDPKSVKRYFSLNCIFLRFLGSTSIKAVCRTLKKLSPWLNLMKLLGAYLGAWLSLVNGVGYLSMRLKVNRLGSGWTTNDLN